MSTKVKEGGGLVSRAVGFVKGKYEDYERKVSCMKSALSD